MHKMSIVVTTYNQSNQSIIQTLNSLVAQDLDSFEIIVADDCSKESPKEAIEAYFKKKGFVDYKIIINKKNLGTVKNFLGAIKISDGEYVKGIGAGDLLYSSETLRKIYGFSKQNEINLAFGKIETFSHGNGEVATRPFNAPRNPAIYCGDQDREQILKQMLVNGDWLPGGALFFQREYSIDYLTLLADEYRIKYCEDLVSALIAFNDRIEYFDEYLMWYEWGVGISNDGSISSKRRMYDDHGSFFLKLSQQYPDDVLVRKACRRFRLKRFVMLNTPLSGVLSRFKSKQYLDGPKNRTPERKFLLACLDI